MTIAKLRERVVRAAMAETEADYMLYEALPQPKKEYDDAAAMKAAAVCLKAKKRRLDACAALALARAEQAGKRKKR